MVPMPLLGRADIPGPSSAGQPGGSDTGVRGPGAPSVEAYVEALLAIYRNPQIRLRLVSPLSWVAARVEAQAPLPSSPAAVGAELAVLPNGDLYAGERAVGLERWRLGNVLQDPQDIRWERLDAMAEEYSNAMMPAECQGCDWRYRCGGVDASVRLMEEAASQRPADAGRTQAAPLEDAGRMPAPLFELYCAPRKRLFEEILWGSAEAAANGRRKPGRERIELREDGIDFAPANNT